MKYPAYQINIPSPVRFDRQLSAHAKLLYGEIKALCDKEGYCWASNRYLASLYGVKKETISYWLRQLRNQSLIQIQIDEKQANLRRIYLHEFTEHSYENIDKSSEKSEEAKGQNGRGTVNLSPPSSDSIAPKQESLLIDNIIDYNDRVYDNNMFIKNRIGIEKKGKGYTERVDDNCSGEKAPSPRVAPPPLPQKETAKGGATFVRPSVKEVEDHMLGQKEICANVMTARGQALRFVNYYESNGWKVGRNDMQDWQAAANNWLLNSQNYTTSKSSTHERLHTTRNKDYSIPL
ncbi:helix-turn-helix domain-containing protein [Catalinimonas niigatensis]|uniref:helix-turn-helix domain-containing protein n=1 Tax=Catalinimonas niigatensis TaxID=1397264 RepID=UPI0026663556|nr:helix-turn-helix domain-containing protein [Catalinimonas niigatensis]WPP51771.1 helix-turn-helix domain-containing protein [Catalinimonas niigatensis]